MAKKGSSKGGKGGGGKPKKQVSGSHHPSPSIRKRHLTHKHTHRNSSKRINRPARVSQNEQKPEVQLQANERVEAVRPLWESLPQLQRQQLLTVDLQLLRDRAQQASQEASKQQQQQQQLQPGEWVVRSGYVCGPESAPLLSACLRAHPAPPILPPFLH